MNIYVLNQSFEFVGLIDTYSSIIWSTRYYSIGDFELYIAASDKMIDLLKKDYYLVRERDIFKNNGTVTYKNVMIIEKIKMDTDVENGNFLTVTGSDLKTIIKRRIIWQQTNLSGKAEAGIRQLLSDNIISPTVPSRKISNFKLGSLKNFTETLEIQITGDNLWDSIESICKTYEYGADVYIENNNFIFDLYKGKNRSYSQNELPYVVFSPEFENLSTSSYTYSAEDYKNVALVAGEGEGLERKTQAVGTASGVNRYETYVDSRNTSSNSGEYTDTEYAGMLIAEGTEALAETTIKESFEGSAETSFGFKLNEDYFLGDVVQVINKYGISASPRILEIIENEDDNGVSIIPTFSTWEV